MHDLDELAAFVAVMQSGSLTLSARQQGLAKSTLSRRISQLESRLGQRLLFRQANRLIPTEAGVLYLDYCHQILRLAEQGQQALDELRQDISGELKVDVHSAFSRGWFPRCLERFLSLHPGVRLELRTLISPPATPDENRLCLWLGSPGECGLRQEVIGNLTHGVYAHPTYYARYGTPLHPCELASHDWVDLLGDAEEGLQLFHAEQGVFRIAPTDSRLRVDQNILQLDAIARGHGLGVLADWMVERHQQAHPGTLLRCLPEWQAEQKPVTLLYPFGRPPRKLGALLEYLHQAIPAGWQQASPTTPAKPEN